MSSKIFVLGNVITILILFYYGLANTEKLLLKFIYIKEVLNLKN